VRAWTILPKGLVLFIISEEKMLEFSKNLSDKMKYGPLEILEPVF
jgi:hypothetical protein